MEQLSAGPEYNFSGRSSNLRDILAVPFRHRGLMVLSFLGILLGAVLAAMLQSNQYEARMKILVKRDRVDPIVTPDATAVPIASAAVSEEELNSEIELLKSRELLEKIVLACGLQHRGEGFNFGPIAAMLSRNGRSPQAKETRAASPHPGKSETLRSLPSEKRFERPSSTHVPAVPLLRVLPDLREFDSVSVPSGTEIRVDVAVNEQGRVSEAHINDVPLKSPSLVSATETAAKQWLFEPAKTDGINVASRHTIKFQFQQKGTESAAGLKTGAMLEAAARRHQSPKEFRSSDPPEVGSSEASVSGPPAASDREEHVQLPGSPDALQIARAVRRLEKELKVELVKKTNLIAVTYRSRDPQLAARVLSTMANLYIEKHVAVHRPPGTFNFFHQEAERYRHGLTEAEERLVDFNHSADVVSAPLEKEAALQRLAEFDVALKQTQAAIDETQQRIRRLQEEAASTPRRMTTQVRNTDDGQLLSQLRLSLLSLEQKRTELLGKFAPSYRPVQEIEAQIAQARLALSSAEKSQLREETTDRDPAYEWSREELAKAQADLAGLEARARATSAAVESYRERARSLEEKEMVQNDLARTIKASEQNYLLYLRKEEEARMSDALDRGRILNVAIAEAATVPSLPSNSRSITILAGFFMAMLISVGLAFVSERLDSTFRTPYEIESVMSVPVLASMPQNGKKALSPPSIESENT